MCRIIKVKPMENYHLEVQLDSGSSVILNLKDRLNTARFMMISDTDIFQRASTDGSYIRWDNKVEISVNEVFQLAKKGFKDI